MAIFGKPKRHYAKKAPKTLDSILSSSMNRVLTKNPGLAEKLAARQFHYDDLIAEPDEGEKVKKDMQAIILKQALHEIQINPELSKRLAERKVEEILGITAEGNGRELDSYSGSSVSQLMEEFDQYDELRKRFGGSEGGALGGLVDKDTINNILQLLITAQQNKGGSGTKVIQQERQVLVCTPDGTLAEVPESKYLELYKQGQLKPVAALTAPKQDQIAESVISQPAKEASPSIDDLLDIVSLLEIEEFTNYTSEELVERINSEIAEGVTRATLLKTLLQSITYEQVVQYITPYKSHEQVGKYVERLLTPEGKVWTEKVLELVRNEKIS